MSKVNITIADVEAELELIIRLGNCKACIAWVISRILADCTIAVVSIVNRTLASLDLNPLLINLLNEVTDVVTEVVAAVDSLLGSIVQGNSKINFIIDNLGNIVSCSLGNTLVSRVMRLLTLNDLGSRGCRRRRQHGIQHCGQFRAEYDLHRGSEDFVGWPDRKDVQVRRPGYTGQHRLQRPRTSRPGDGGKLYIGVINEHDQRDYCGSHDGGSDHDGGDDCYSGCEIILI